MDQPWEELIHEEKQVREEQIAFGLKQAERPVYMSHF